MTRPKVGTYSTFDVAGVAAKFFRGLGDPVRLRILGLLLDHGEMNVSQLTEQVALPRSRISTHLACLRSCGYLSSRREGRFTLHSVKDQRLGEMLDLARSLSLDHEEAIACCPIIDEHAAGIVLLPLPSRLAALEEAGSLASELPFGMWLQRRMEQRGLQAADLAAALEVSVAAVQRWLYRGGYPLPGSRVRLAATLGVTPDEVRRRTGGVGNEATTPLAAWLQQQLYQRDWTQTHLARTLGLEPHTVLQWCRGGAVPRRRNLERLATALDISVDAIPVA